MGKREIVRVVLRKRVIRKIVGGNTIYNSISIGASACAFPYFFPTLPSCLFCEVSLYTLLDILYNMYNIFFYLNY